MYDTLAQAFAAFLRDHGVFFASLSAVLIAATCVAIGAWWQTSERLRAAQQWLLHHAKDGDDIGRRLGAIEGAVDTLAIGVERLTETELFAARIAAETRSRPAAPAEPPRVITPH